MIAIIIIFVFTVLYFYKYSKIENFTASQSITISSGNGKYLGTRLGGNLVFSDTPTNFIVKLLNNGVVALSSNGMYLNVSIGNIVAFNSYSPFTKNSQIALIPNGSFYIIQFYNGMYLSPALAATNNVSQAQKFTIE